MDPKIQKIINSLKGIKLSVKEKNLMKSVVFERLKWNEAPAYQDESSVVNSLFFIFRTHATVTATILIIAFAGGGVSFAAEGSLPGTPLYPVKVHFNEGLRSALAVSPDDRAKWSSERVGRRLQEAKKLSDEGRMNNQIEEEIKSKLVEHAGEAYRAIEALEAKGDITSVVQAVSQLESILEAHRTILSSGDDDSSEEEIEATLLLENEEDSKNGGENASSSEEASSSDIKQNLADVVTISATEGTEDSGSLLKTIEDNLEIIVKSKIEVEKEINTLSDREIYRESRDLSKEVKYLKRRLERRLSRIDDDLSRNVISFVENEINWIDELLKSADESIEKSEYRNALKQLQQAMHAGKTLEIYMGSHVTLQKIIEERAEEESNNLPEVEGSATTTVSIADDTATSTPIDISEEEDNSETSTSTEEVSTSTATTTQDNIKAGYRQRQIGQNKVIDITLTSL